MKRFILTSTGLALLAMFGLSASVDAAPRHAVAHVGPAHVAPAHVVSHGHVAPVHVIHPAYKRRLNVRPIRLIPCASAVLPPIDLD